MAKRKDHLQCGCQNVKQPNIKIHPTENQTRGDQCECTIQTDKGFKKTKKGIKTLKFKSIFLGKDSSIN